MKLLKWKTQSLRMLEKLNLRFGSDAGATLLYTKCNFKYNCGFEMFN